MKLELRKWTKAEKDDLIRICNEVDRSNLSDRMPKPYTEESADWWLDMVSEHDGRDGLFRAISVDDVIVGNISIEQKEDVYRRDGEIGYLLLEKYKRQGIMTEAVRRICELGFSELNILRITGVVYAPNLASRRVLEKNGFLQEGMQKNAVYKDGKVYDLCLYGKLKE